MTPAQLDILWRIHAGEAKPPKGTSADLLALSRMKVG